MTKKSVLFPRAKVTKDIWWLNRQKVERLIFWLLVFFLPTQLGYHFWPSFAYIFGIKVDYLAPTVYLTDLLVWLLVVISFKQLKKYWLFLSFVLVFAVANTYFAQSRILAAIKWLKIFELSLFGLYVFLNRKLVWQKKTAWVLVVSTVFFSLLGIFQFMLQRTLGGPLYYLGERVFSSHTPGIALVELFGREMMRAYSTFSHPNSLAGFLFVALIIIVSHLKKTTSSVLLIPVAVAFALTFSTGALVGVAAVIFFYLVNQFFPKATGKTLYVFLFGIVILSLLLPLVAGLVKPYLFMFPETLKVRLIQAEMAGKIFSLSPVVGAGLNNFLKASMFLQPVHNLFLLILAETGLTGLMISVYFFFKVLKQNQNIFLALAFIFILVTGFFDHYWLTLQQNLLLFSLVLGLSSKKEE